MLMQISEARRMHGTSERDGTVYQVWRQDKEQKVRLTIGTRPDGSPWLSPWLKIEDHHGPARHQHKFFKGQNVKLTTQGADFSQAKITPAGENNANPEPQHATDYHETSQYASSRTRLGPDFEERWLASGAQVSGQDPDKISQALVRWGAKPQAQNDNNEPWDGPDPSQANPQKRHLKWVGSPGNTPQQNGDAITTQFDQNVKTETTATGILHKVQSGGSAMPIPDTGDGTAQRTTTDNMQDSNILRKIHDLVNQLTTSSQHTSGQVTHIIMDQAGNIATKVLQKNQIIHQLQDANGNFSSILQQAEQVMHQVTGSGGTSTLQITGSAINLNSKSVQINTDTFSTPTTAPSIPVVNSSGNAPLVVIPTQWSIEAALVIGANIYPNMSLPEQQIAAGLSPAANMPPVNLTKIGP
jgi:hypothetical protein